MSPLRVVCRWNSTLESFKFPHPSSSLVYRVVQVINSCGPHFPAAVAWLHGFLGHLHAALMLKLSPSRSCCNFLPPCFAALVFTCLKLLHACSLFDSQSSFYIQFIFASFLTHYCALVLLHVWNSFCSLLFFSVLLLLSSFGFPVANSLLPNKSSFLMLLQVSQQP